MLTRRQTLAGIVGAASHTLNASAATSTGDPEYKEYPFIDYYSSSPNIPFGVGAASQSDIDAAKILARSMGRASPLEVMQNLASITKRGSTGELFNARWAAVGNPLIVLFFHEIGYVKTPYPGDCTPWCAATVAWCLKTCGYSVPPDPASSQSYLRYGTEVPLSQIREGDLCVFTDLGDRAHGHIAFYLLGAPLGQVMCLGGNQEGKSATNCGIGYRQSKIKATPMTINPRRDRSVYFRYLASVRRPA